LSPAEATLRAAVLKWCVFQKPPYDTRWIEKIDGRSEPYPLDQMNGAGQEALSKAIPLLTTITEAFAKYQMFGKARPRTRIGVWL
jgi:hypothetical protein